MKRDVITFYCTVNYIISQIVIARLWYFQSMEEKSFKDRLTDELNYQGISNKEFAHQVGISMGTLGMYLYRGSIPAADVAVKMAQVLNTTAEYLVLGTSDNKPLPTQSAKADWQKKEINVIVERLPQDKLASFLEIARAFKNAVDVQ